MGEVVEGPTENEGEGPSIFFFVLLLPPPSTRSKATPGYLTSSSFTLSLFLLSILLNPLPLSSLTSNSRTRLLPTISTGPTNLGDGGRTFTKLTPSRRSQNEEGKEERSLPVRSRVWIGRGGREDERMSKVRGEEREVMSRC